MMGFLFSVLAGVAVALLFSLAIFIHEFGHFIVAPLLGLQVDAFSIGFGPALWKWSKDGVEYKISAIPFGGYVALPQLDPSGMERIQGDNQDGKENTDTEFRQLPEVAAWKRIAVALSGPVGNLLLALLLAFAIFWAPSAKTGVVTSRIGGVDNDSPAWEAGLRSGDQIISINGTPIATWHDLQVESQLAGDNLIADVVAMRGDEQHEFAILLDTNNIFGLRIMAGVYPEVACELAEVLPDTPASRAGLQASDIVLAVGDVPILGAFHFVSIITKSKGNTTSLLINRGGKKMEITVTPEYVSAEERYMIGVRWNSDVSRVKPWMMYRKPMEQLRWDFMAVKRVLDALFRPKSKSEFKAVTRSVGGPVAIVMGLYDTVKGSMIDALGFLRMICVNLAILNLLPLPVLDGGHIVFALYEIVTRRKPHPKLVAVLVNTFAVLLIGLMLLLVYSDIAKRIKAGRMLRALEQQVEAVNTSPEPVVETAP